MAQDQRFSTPPFSRRRFLQYSGSMALSGSLLAACAGTGSGGAASSGGSSGPIASQSASLTSGLNMSGLDYWPGTGSTRF